ncbi:MAG: LuxR C-terminal-related transcriptional regulator [Rhizomicrobium sp.]|nr:LuxR C-terminal-related transcriptional regulator [Rhizomicrobium sp.]
MNSNAPICIVDDDDDVRNSLRVLLEAADFPVKDYPSADAFLSDDVFSASCLIADVCMPGMDGLALQHEVSRRRRDLPVVFLSGLGEVGAAVQAMKAGAVDFLEKPLDGDAFLACIRRALARGAHDRTVIAQTKTARRLIASLTPREADVMEKLVDGLSNKAVAQDLGISPRTVEVYRAQIMNKLKAGNLSDIVRIAIAAKAEIAL